jgi:hypothetical protein
MLAQQIMINWDTSAKGYATKIVSLFDAGYPAWTIKTTEIYGVAIPVPENTEVSESFSGAKLYNDIMMLDGTEQINVLLLTTKLDSIRYPFATLCAELIAPGENGSLRKEVETNPVSWWMQWKELLGNKNVDDRIYDVLGELTVLRYLTKNGEQAIWNGPTGSTYDIDCDSIYYEVKSTVVRKKRQITLNNHFQLDPPDGKGLKLALCQFEPAQSGISIDSLVDDLVQYGYSRQDLNLKLEILGLEKGKSARKRCYDLHSMIMYTVNQQFPAIRESSFIGGTLPTGIESITYTISLDGVEGEKIVE